MTNDITREVFSETFIDPDWFLYEINAKHVDVRYWSTMPALSEADIVAILSGYDPRFPQTAEARGRMDLLEIYVELTADLRRCVATASELGSLKLPLRPAELPKVAQRLGAKLPDGWPAPVPEPEGKPMHESERKSLLFLVKTLSAMAGLDLAQPFKAAGVVEEWASQHGVPAPTTRTVGDKLKEARDIDR